MDTYTDPLTSAGFVSQSTRVIRSSLAAVRVARRWPSA